VPVWQCLTALAVLSTTFTVVSSFAAVQGLGTSSSTDLLWAFEFRLILAWWVSVDRRIRDFNVPYEFDAFVFFTWPLSVPYYLYRTRGGRGVLLSGCIYIFYLTPGVVVEIARIVR
jgi:hypothetical protein